MSIQSLTYQDLPPSKRRASASKAIQKLREQLNTSALGPEQTADCKAQIERLEKWAAGTLSQGA